MGISGTGVLWPQMAWFVWLKSDFLRNIWIYLYINQSLIGDLKDLVKKLFALSKMDIMTGTELISQLCLARRKAPLLMLITLYNRENETSTILKTKRAKCLFFSLPFFL